MSAWPINFFDLMVIVIVLLSGLVAFARGMVRELLKLASWIGAAVVTSYGFAYVRPMLRDLIHIRPIADAVGAIGIFLISLILFSFVANLIAEHVRDSAFKGFDRTLGFVFGLIRGAVIVSLAYLFLILIVTPANLPDWIREARTRPLVEYGVELLATMAPKNLRLETRSTIRVLRMRGGRAIETERAVRGLIAPPPIETGKERRGRANRRKKGKQ